MINENIKYYSNYNIQNHSMYNNIHQPNNNNMIYLHNYYNNFQRSLTPKNNYNYYNSYNFIIPVQYAPVNYLMSDSIYDNSFVNKNINKKYSTNFLPINTKLNLNNSTKYSIPSEFGDYGKNEN